MIFSNFNQLNLKQNLLKGIEVYGLENLTEIQKKVFDPFIDHQDILAQGLLFNISKTRNRKNSRYFISKHISICHSNIAVIK